MNFEFSAPATQTNGTAEAKQGLDQPRAQLDQVVHQRRFAALYIFGAHDALASLGTSDIAGAAGSGRACGVMTNGSVTAEWVVASTKVSGVGASGIVGVTGASLDVAC